MNLPKPVADAIQTAAQNHRLSPYALLQKTTARRIVNARRDCFLDLRSKGFSLPFIARWFGMHYSTVRHHLGVLSKPLTPRCKTDVRTTEEFSPMIQRAAQIQCDHCGYASHRAAEFKPEDYHHVCKNGIECEARYQSYLKVRKELAEEMRQRHMLTA